MNTEQPITYPSPRDLELILADSVKKGDLMAFLRKRGIFFFNTSMETLAKQVSIMYWDYDSLEELRGMAYRTSNKKVLSGFSLMSSSEFALNDIYDGLRMSGELKEDGYTLNSITKKKSSSEVIYGGTLSYVKKSAGRMEFIRTEVREVSFEMRQINPNEWQVEVDGGKSNDGKVVYGLLERIAKKQDVSINMLRIDRLTKASTISFFDQLAKIGLPKEWIIEDISRITLKRNPGTKDDMNLEIEEEDDDIEEVNKEDLSGITQAILEGKNLREQDFVRRAEVSGYAFTSMTYTFYRAETNAKVKLRAEFKGNPKIFEVGLESYLIPANEGEDRFEDSISSLSDSDNMSLRSIFWNNAQSLYYSLLSAK